MGSGWRGAWAGCWDPGKLEWRARGAGPEGVAAPLPECWVAVRRSQEKWDWLSSSLTVTLVGGHGCRWQVGPTGQCRAGLRGCALLGWGGHLSCFVSCL